MKYLIVVAHPDDETLGVGGTMYKLSKDNEVDVAILSANVNARKNKSTSLDQDLKKALDILGVQNFYKGNFENIKMNVEPHIEVVKFIEKCICESEPDVVITHHPSDTNNDHTITSYGTQAAIRLFQRREGTHGIKKLFFMEVPSSTEWSVDSSSNRFQPNYFFEINQDGLEKKIEALSAYKGVMRAYPHPRSKEAISGLASYRGAQSGLLLAEALELVFERVEND